MNKEKNKASSILSWRVGHACVLCVTSQQLFLPLADSTRSSRESTIQFESVLYAATAL